MLIRIRHNSGACDYVKPHVLDHLIATGQIISFHRDGGIAVLGVHPVRRGRGDNQIAVERRHRSGVSAHAA